MAVRFNTAAIRSNPAPAAAVGESPTWLSQWSAATGGNLERTMRLARRPAALELGERVEIPAGELRLVEVGTTGGLLVAGVRVTAAGTGYNSAPTVAFSGGGGTGAEATATVAGGVVTGINITNPGTGYTAAPTVSLTGGGGSGATATALLNGRVLDTVAAQQLAGETSTAKHYQLHDGDPGAAGTNNVIAGIGRIEQPANNWTAGT